MSEIMDLSLSQLSLVWFKQTSFVGRHMKMLVLISNTFRRSVAPSPSKEWPKTPYYVAFSHSHPSRRQSNGSTPTKIETLHGITAPLPF